MCQIPQSFCKIWNGIKTKLGIVFSTLPDTKCSISIATTGHRLGMVKWTKIPMTEQCRIIRKSDGPPGLLGPTFIESHLTTLVQIFIGLLGNHLDSQQFMVGGSRALLCFFEHLELGKSSIYITGPFQLSYHRLFIISSCHY